MVQLNRFSPKAKTTKVSHLYLLVNPSDAPFVLWIDGVELRPEPDESPADGVYRYLEGIVAWAVALHQLLKPDLVRNFSAISASVVLVTGFRSDVMSSDDVISGLLERYPIQKTSSKPLSRISSPKSHHSFMAQFTQRRLSWDLFLILFLMIMNVADAMQRH